MAKQQVSIDLIANTAKMQTDMKRATDSLYRFKDDAKKTAAELRRMRSDIAGVTTGAGSLAQFAEQAAKAGGASDNVTGALSSMSSGMMQARQAALALAAAKTVLMGPIGLLTVGVTAAIAVYAKYSAAQQDAAKLTEEAAQKAKEAAAAEEARARGVDEYLTRLRMRLAGERELHAALKDATEDEMRRARDLEEMISRKERYRAISDDIASREDAAAVREEKANMRRFHMLLGLERQVATMRMSREELELYNMQMAGGTEQHAEMIRKLQEQRIAIEQEALAREAARRQAAQTETFLFSTIRALEDQQKLLALGNTEYLVRKMAAAGASEGEIEHTTFLLASIEAIRTKNAESQKAHQAEMQRMEAEKRARQMLAQTVIGTLSTITSISAKESKKQFEIHKRVSIAEAIANTAAGITRAFKDLGPWAAWSQAASVAAAGAAQIAAIRSTTFEGGGTVTGPTAAPTESASRAPARVIIDLHGDSFSGDSMRALVGKLADAQKDGYILEMAS
jgi:hypothetical protein